MLSRARLIHGNLSKKDDGASVYVLRRDGSTVTLGELYDAFMSLPREGSARKPLRSIKPDVSKRIEAMRKDYIAALDTIPVLGCAEKDVCM